MPIDLIGRQIFLASPGDVAEERDLCRRVVTEFNSNRARQLGATFIVRGWEQVPGGVGRPQSLINPHLDECDYMVLILGHRWGSPTGVDGQYTSGTEEEFFHCLELLADTEGPMRDVLVLLKVLEPDRLADPGDQLKQVIDFRRRLEESKQIMYVSFDSDDKLRIALETSLEAWAQPLQQREPVEITLPTSSSPARDSGLTTDQMLIRAKELYQDGLVVQANELYSAAIQGNNPQALSEYAQFSRRTGNLDLALELNKRILRIPATDSVSVKYRVRSLSNMGVILRKRGDIEGSKDMLREAIATIEQSDYSLTPELCYALDNHGISLARSNDLEGAKQQLQQSYAKRQELGDDHATAQSAINLGRISLQAGEFQQAEDLFEEAASKLNADSGALELANARAGIAEAKLRRNQTDGVESLISQAQETNEAHKSSDGLSITFGLQARLALLNQDRDGALRHAAQCATEARKSGSLVGIATSLWIQAEVALLENKRAEALELLAEADANANRAHAPLLAGDIMRTRERVEADA